MGRVSISLLDVPHIDLALHLIGGLDLMVLPGVALASQLAVKKVLPGLQTFAIGVRHKRLAGCSCRAV